MHELTRAQGSQPGRVLCRVDSRSYWGTDILSVFGDDTQHMLGSHYMVAAPDRSNLCSGPRLHFPHERGRLVLALGTDLKEQRNYSVCHWDVARTGRLRGLNSGTSLPC